MSGIKRGACATSVAVVVVWCVVSVDGREWCCVGACVSPRRARARVSEQMVCREQQQARGQTTREQRETVQVHHEQLVSGGSRPGGQAGRGWYLFETRSDGGIASLAYRRAGTSWDELGQANGCLCEDGYTVLL